MALVSRSREPKAAETYSESCRPVVVLTGSELIVFSGPTGCGKSTTIYSILNEFDPLQHNIQTAESPIEVVMPHVNQVEISDFGRNTFLNLGERHRKQKDMAILAAMTVADWAPEQLAQAEADEMARDGPLHHACVRAERPAHCWAWRAGKSSVEMDAKPIGALRIASTRQRWRTASVRAEALAPTTAAPSAASRGKTRERW
jgi:hypothetical protein